MGSRQYPSRPRRCSRLQNLYLDEVWLNDPYGRSFAGLPPAKSGDFAWVQYMIKSMAPKTGRMAVVLPHGVLFIDAAREFKTGRAQNELLPEHVDRIHQWYTAYRAVDGVCRVVSLADIRDNDFNLNIPRYVEPVIEEETMSVEQALTNLKQSLEAAYAAEDRLMELLKKAGMMT